jgi:AcrR family transcriptional regulator
MRNVNRAKRKSAPVDSGDKRARILEAALNLFESRGFDGVAVPEIAKAARVATGTIYRYFKTKEALVNALYRQWKSAYNDQILGPVPDGLTPRETFSLYWQRMAEFARTNYRAVRFLDLHFHAPYLDAESRAMDGVYMVTARSFVEAGRKARTLRPIDPALIVALMWGATTGLNKFVRDGVLVFNHATSRAMEEALWRAIANDSQPSKGESHGTKKKR